MKKICMKRGIWAAVMTTAATTWLAAGATSQKLFAADPVIAAASPAAANAPVDTLYPVSGLKVHYQLANENGVPDLKDLLPLTVSLSQSTDGYIAPTPAAPQSTVTLADLAGPAPRGLHASAINAICERIVKFYNDKGLVGIFVAPDPREINPTDGSDLRDADHKELDLIVYVSRVKQVRTVASGSRIPEDKKINNPAHDTIRKNSPAQPAGPGQPANSDLIDKTALDDYVFRLNRQPGRRVDVAISGADQPGQVDLDYLVAETRPWFAFFELSNTGTRQTSIWREHFGYVNNQLTGHDDILTLDYDTANFSRSQSVLTSYDFPIAGVYKVRGKVYGTYDDFTASDVGFVRQRFNGEEIVGGAELAANVYQHKDYFIDAFGGARYQRERVDDVLPNTTFDPAVERGVDQLVIPYAGVRFSKTSDIQNTQLSAQFIYGSSFETTNIGNLRAGADGSFMLIQGDASESFFLEPLLRRAAFKNGEVQTLAHEIGLSVRGQYSPSNSRLIPEIESTVGGLYSVRGYPESIAAGDNALYGTVEYRYHIPRGFKPSPGAPDQQLFGMPFRTRPTEAYGRPDWDLIFRAFVDAGATYNDRRAAFESDNTLVGTGVGLEFLLRQNIDIRADWGVALTQVNSPGYQLVKPGSNQFHFSFSFVY